MGTNKLMVLSILLVFLIVGSAFGDTPEAKLKKSMWEDTRRVDEFEAYVLLLPKLESGAILNFPEYKLWQKNKPIKDPDRKNNLNKVLTKYSGSQFADDAALLMARSYLLIDNAPEMAIRELYKVIKKFPEANFIAEDRIWLDTIPYFLQVNKDGSLSARPPQEYQGNKRFMYLRYLDDNPHKTVDEARYWIAESILSSDLKNDRFDEAVENLKLVINKYKAPDKIRTLKDLNGLKELSEKTNTYNWIDRAEIRCHERLVLAYMEAEDYVNAAKEASEFLELYSGHPKTNGMYYYAGQSNESLQQWDKAIEYYSKFLNYTQNLELREKLGNKLKILQSKKEGGN